MPKFYTYAPGTKGSKLKLRPSERLGFVRDKGYYAIPEGGRSVQAQQMAAAAKAAQLAKRNAPIDVNQVINRYFRQSELFLSPEEQRRRARQQVDDAMAEQERAFERQREANRERNASQQLTAEGLALAMAGMRTADAPLIEQAWKQAAGNMTSFASALTGGLQGAQTAALQGAQSDVNRLVQGGGQVQAPSPAANAAVASAVGGSIPAATAMRNAEAQYQAAVASGDAAAARFWDQQRAFAYEGLQQEGESSADWRELQRQRPKLLRESEAQMEDERRQELATLMNVVNLQSGLAETQSEINKRAADIRLKNKSLTLQQARDQANKELAAERNQISRQRNEMYAEAAKERARISAMNAATARGKALGIDPDTGMPLPGYRFDPKTGRVIKDPKQTGRAQQSEKMERDFRTNATAWFRDNFINELTGIPRERPPSKAELVRRFMAQYGNAVVGKGVSAAGARMWVTQMLNSWPKAWWNPQFYKASKPAGGQGGGSTVVAP